MNPLMRIVLLLVVGFVAIAPCGFVAAQDKVVLTREQWETGFHAFSQVMRKRDIEIFRDYETWRESPANRRILVLMGEITENDQNYVNEFVSSGGSALIATDSLFGPAQIDRHLVTITQGGAIAAARQNDSYRGVDGWPIVSRIDRDEPIFDGVNQIVPNYPALLVISNRPNRSSGWETIARYPALRIYGNNQPFAVKYENRNGGRLLIVPDHSIYVNGSVVVNDNLRFMLNTVDWLRNGGRTKCLFVLNGANAVPMNVSNVDLYTAPPGAAETRRLLSELMRNTTTRDKIELANESLEFIQEEQLMEQIVEAVNLDEIIPPSQLFKWLLITTAWLSVVTFVIVLVSNRKKPLEGNSADGLLGSEKKERKRREKLERARAAEALFVHFFNRVGMAISQPREIDTNLISHEGNEKQTRKLRKDIEKISNDLTYQEVHYWTDAKVEEVGRYIAQWANLSDTGVLRIESPAD